MPKSIIAIYNPNARKGKTIKNVEYFIDKLKESGIDYQYTATKHPEDVQKIVSQYKKEGYNAVVTIGGDGAVHFAANAAINEQLPFGVIPAGSGNDFAGTIGIRDDIDLAVETILADNSQRISALESHSSIGKFYTVNMIDCGVGAVVADSTNKHLRNLAGPIKYNIVTIWELLRNKPFPVRITLDGEEEETDIRLLITGMGQTAGSGMHFTPDVRYTHDTMQGGIIYGTSSRFELIRALQKVRRGQHTTLPFIKMFRAKRVTVEGTQGELMIEAEGEIKGYTPLKLEVKKEILEVFVPKHFSLDNRTLSINYKPENYL